MGKDLYKALIDTIWELQDGFTSDELEQALDTKGIEVKDINGLLDFLSGILIKEDGRYYVNVVDMFYRVYPQYKNRGDNND
ncbi:hypothetical protein SP15_187 [Bacillus phage SP-15]|uniref:Uncharacterized protein n=1 Tax=Bacillus phage SP-15 TaxID=1792032 RepID=A0A127AWM5_9CAUD|nr:hypothetical protein SP15_187 [Bacillus phage SP-15]AMM44987.1 hypothetical protein SP15_187 [Bacillus phage SP-15]